LAEAGDTGAPLVCMWWGRYEVPQLAGFLSEDLEAGWGHAVAWSGTAELADTYRARLQGVRDGLAAVWPPERSAAAAVYLGRLDSMIASLADVNETASVNYRALGGVLDALQGARAKIYELDDRYQKADAAARAVLNQQAQQHMSEADDVVVSHYGQLTSPKPTTQRGGSTRRPWRWTRALTAVRRVPLVPRGRTACGRRRCRSGTPARLLAVALRSVGRRCWRRRPPRSMSVHPA